MRFRSGLLTALVVLLVALVRPVSAGEIEVSVDAAARTARVVAKDAALDEVLDKLSAALDFKVSRTGQGGSAGPVSGRFEGPIDVGLSRLLRGEGHMIQRSEEAKSGIVHIVLFGSTNPAAGGTAMANRRPGRHRPTNAESEDDDDEEQARAEEEAMRQAEQQRQRAAKLRAMHMRQQVRPGATLNRAGRQHDGRPRR